MKSSNRRTRVKTWALAVLASGFVASAAPAPATEAATNKTEIPKSVFKFDKRAGRDPFFPKSARLQGRSGGGDQAPALADLTDLVHLRGITGPQSSRVALINHLPLKEGEEADVRVDATRRIKVKVVKILEDSVRLRFPDLPPQTGEVVKKIEATMLPLTRE